MTAKAGQITNVRSNDSGGAAGADSRRWMCWWTPEQLPMRAEKVGVQNAAHHIGKRHGHHDWHSGGDSGDACDPGSGNARKQRSAANSANDWRMPTKIRPARAAERRGRQLYSAANLRGAGFLRSCKHWPLEIRSAMLDWSRL